MAGAPATSARITRRPTPTERPSATGTAMPRPSVTLWTMKPTIRKVPRASSPTANDDPMARPSPRLCRPMPTAISDARASPWRGCAAGAGLRSARREALGDPRQGQIARRHPQQHQPGPAERAGQPRLELQRLRQRVDGQEGEEAAREGHERGQQARIRAPQRRQPQHPQADGDHAHEEADQGVAAHAAAARSRGLHGGGHVGHALDPGRAGDPDRVRIVLDPVERDLDRGRAQAPQRLRAVGREGVDRVVHRDRRDRDVVGLGVAHQDADLTRVELHPAQVERVGRGRGGPHQAGDRAAGRDEGRRDRHQQDDRHQHQQAHAPAATAAPAPIDSVLIRPARRSSPSTPARRTRTGGRGT